MSTYQWFVGYLRQCYGPQDRSFWQLSARQNCWKCVGLGLCRDSTVSGSNMQGTKETLESHLRRLQKA